MSQFAFAFQTIFPQTRHAHATQCQTVKKTKAFNGTNHYSRRDVHSHRCVCWKIKTVHLLCSTKYLQTKQHSFYASIQLRRFHFQFSIILCGHDKQANLTERSIATAKCPFHDKRGKKKNWPHFLSHRTHKLLYIQKCYSHSHRFDIFYVLFSANSVVSDEDHGGIATLDRRNNNFSIKVNHFILSVQL